MRSWFSVPKFYLCITSAMLVLSGCASPNLRVTSSPDKVNVFVAGEGEQPRKIGETPLSVDSQILNTSRGRFVTVILQKEGFKPESILVPTSLMQKSVDVTAKLEAVELPKVCENQTAAIEQLSRGIATVQAMMGRNNFEEARAKIQSLINEYPGVSVLHDLLGNVNYVQKNLEQALFSYERSLAIDPNNMETQRMVTKIKSILQVRVPAGGQ